MKNLIMLIALSLGSFTVHAGPYGKHSKRRAAASLEIYNNSHRSILVEVNGRIIHDAARRSYRISYLPPGKHQLTLLEVRRGRHKPRVIYSRLLRLRPGHEAIIRIGRRGHVRVNVRKSFYCSDCSSYYCGSHSCAADFDDDYDDGYATAMSPAGFHALKASMRRASFESSRKSMMRQALQRHGLNSFQLRELLFLFDYESSRLEMARFAYRRLSDPQNIAVIFDAFEYESSVRQYEDFLNGRY